MDIGAIDAMSMIISQENVLMMWQMEFRWHRRLSFENARPRSKLCIKLCRWRRLWYGFKHVKGKNDDTAFLSNLKRGGPSHVNHDKVLTTKHADFVNKELNAGKGIMSIKKIVMQDKSVNTELDNAYQKTLLTETKMTRKGAPLKWKNGPYWVIMSNMSHEMDLKFFITWT